MPHIRRQTRSCTNSRAVTSSVVTARHAQRRQQWRCTLLFNQCGIHNSLCTAASCCSTSTNLVAVKRSGLNKKRAASRFGEPRLQLSPSSNMPHKVKLAEGLIQPQHWSSGTHSQPFHSKDKLSRPNAIFAAVSLPCIFSPQFSYKIIASSTCFSADASMSGAKTEQQGKQVPDRTSSLLSRPTSSLRLYDSDIREELRDTMLLYNIPFVKDGAGAPTDCPRNRLEA